MRATSPLTAAVPFEPIARWQPVGLLGEGAWSRVLAARPLASTADSTPAYALKLLREEHRADARAIELLCREARVGRKVSHPHVVPVLAAELHSEPYHLVMPRLVGYTLEHRLARRWQPAVPEALWIARQIAEALAAIATAGWMHADVKPANVFVSTSGHATLIDLGFARRLEEMSSIADRPTLGTIAYMAPEMLTARQPADIRSDVYSLGVMLFEMLTHRRLFVTSDVAELARLHRAELADDVRSLAPHVPVGVAALVRVMLAKQSLRRPEPRELVARLSKLEIETFDARTLVEIV